MTKWLVTGNIPLDCINYQVLYSCKNATKLFLFYLKLFHYLTIIYKVMIYPLCYVLCNYILWGNDSYRRTQHLRKFILVYIFYGGRPLWPQAIYVPNSNEIRQSSYFYCLTSSRGIFAIYFVLQIMILIVWYDNDKQNDILSPNPVFLHVEYCRGQFSAQYCLQSICYLLVK